MTERLLQYIWQFQYFNSNELTCTSGEALTIIQPGQYNIHQGPDFKEGIVKIGGNLWAGNIEVHINASDWKRHMHTGDVNYRNVILHVVWCNDEREGTENIPTLVLQDRVPKFLLQQYASWMKSDQFIPCGSSLGSVTEIVWKGWQERVLVERMERKCGQVMGYLAKNRFHWEEAMWWMLARNFGLYVNADAFGEMASSLPYNVMTKHRLQIHQLEALLFGQCGLLNVQAGDKYAQMLGREYDFLRKKYELRPVNVPVHFLRMRPACFPTVRLAQLAMLLHTTENIFSTVMNASSIAEIKLMLAVTANDYWHYHFRLSEPASYQPKMVGSDMVRNVIVNTITVMLFAYGKHHSEPSYQSKALEWLEQMPAESNDVIRRFKSLGVRVKSARDSQSLIEMKSQYCDERRCLECAVAANLLKGIKGDH